MLLLAVAQLACIRPDTLGIARVAEAAQPLNVAIELRLDGSIDLLRLLPDTVVCVARDGSVWPSRTEVAGNRLLVHLLLDASRLATDVTEVACVVAGGLGARGLQAVDGRRLERTREFRIALRPVIAAGKNSPRLIAVNDLSVTSVDEVTVSGQRLTLRFDGALDPASIRPEHCPLVPLLHGQPMGRVVFPDTDWRCEGQRFELELRLAQPQPDLQLVLRQFGVRDALGRAPEPPLVLRVRGS